MSSQPPLPRHSDLSVRHISQFCPALTDLNLKDCAHLTDRTLRSLAANASGTLTKLSLENCRAFGDHAFVSMITQCSAIHDLDLSGTLLSDRSFGEVGQRLDVTRTGLNRCPKLSDEGLQVSRAFAQPPLSASPHTRSQTHRGALAGCDRSSVGARSRPPRRASCPSRQNPNRRLSSRLTSPTLPPTTLEPTPRFYFS